MRRAPMFSLRVSSLLFLFLFIRPNRENSTETEGAVGAATVSQGEAKQSADPFMPPYLFFLPPLLAHSSLSRASVLSLVPRSPTVVPSTLDAIVFFGSTFSLKPV